MVHYYKTLKPDVIIKAVSTVHASKIQAELNQRSGYLAFQDPETHKKGGIKYKVDNVIIYLYTTNS